MRSRCGWSRRIARSGRTCCSRSATRCTWTRTLRGRASSSGLAATPACRPGEEVADYEEYTRLYWESWGDPVIRWLFANVGVAMIFDDHDVHDDWNTSISWLEEMRAKPWWEERIEAALSLVLGLPAHRQSSAAAGLGATGPVPGGERLRGRAARCCGASRRKADHGSNGSRWSYCRDLGRHAHGRVRLARGPRAGQAPADDGGRQGMGTGGAGRTGRLRPSAARGHAAVSPDPRSAPRRGVERGSLRGRLGRAGGARGRADQARDRPRALGRFQRVVPAHGGAADGGRVGTPRAGRRRRSSELAGTSTTPTWRRSRFPRDAQAESAVYQAVCSPFRNPLDSHERRIVRNAPASGDGAPAAAAGPRRGCAGPEHQVAAGPGRRPSTTSSRRWSWRVAARSCASSERCRDEADNRTHRDLARAASRLGKHPFSGKPALCA